MNDELFKRKVRENGLKYKFLADKIGVTEFGLLKKRNGSIPWKVSEINILTALLHLTTRERDTIFDLESPK